MATLPILVRIPDTVSILEGPAQLSQGALQNVSATSVVFSLDGSKLFVNTAEAVNIHDTASSALVGTIAAPNTYLHGISRGGQFYITCRKPQHKGGDADKNLQVWRLSTLQPVLELHQKAVQRDAWPYIDWTGDDALCFHSVTNNVRIYSQADDFKAYRPVPVKGVVAFGASPEGLLRVAAFCPESKGQPAAAIMLDVSGPDPVQLLRKSFFRATGARVLWSPRGAAALLLATAEADATNQSYYGEQKLYFLPGSAADADTAAVVPLPKEGPVHDVAWSPAGDYFACVAGFMPARVMLFDTRCRPVYDLGSGPYNILRWNPFGRFLCVAGFGNLPGDIVFFDKKASGACKQMGAVRCEAVTLSWSPCGRYVLAATIAPRLRVDNRLNVFTYYGAAVSEKRFEVLLEASWVPAPAGTFLDRPQSPERIATASSPAGGSGAAGGRGADKGLAKGPAIVGPAKAAAYVPPALRAAGGSTTPAGVFSLAQDSSAPGRVKAAKPTKPGEEFVSKASSKNSKKRANKKKSDGREGNGDGGADEEADASSAVASIVSAVEAVSVQECGVVEAMDPAECVKRARALQKKLRQIEQLKERRDREGLHALEPEQLQKIGTEQALQAELAALGE